MKYIVEPAYGFGHGKDERINRYKELRAWLWDSFGPGCELDYVTLSFTPSMNPVERWAWRTDNGHMRLYLRSDEELTLLKLKWL